MTSAAGAGPLNLGSIPSYPLDNDVLDLDLGGVFPEAANGARRSMKQHCAAACRLICNMGFLPRGVSAERSTS